MRGIERLVKDTVVSFPGNEVSGHSTVIAIKSLTDNQLAIFVEATPFHPVDHLWPDQPADKGEITINGDRFALIHCVTAAFCTETQILLMDVEIKNEKIRRDQEGWIWLVAHIISGDEMLAEAIIGNSVLLTVDAEYRNALSRAHSVCHLAALFLNQVISDTHVWSKPCDQQDSLGNADFDRLALTSSKIEADKSIDQYRVGKSLKKKYGLNIALIIGALEEIQKKVQKAFEQWMVLREPILLEPSVTDLSVARLWKTHVDGREVSIPCGGTHVAFFDSRTRVQTTLKVIDAESFEMINEVQECSFS